MDIRYSCGPKDFSRYNTQETRKEFLIETLFTPGEVNAVYSHVDRMVTLGIMPVSDAVSIDQGIDVWHNFGTSYFLERRECGMFNVGGSGTVTVDRKCCSPATIRPSPPSSTWCPPRPIAATRTS